VNITEICAACGDTRLNHVYHNESECQLFTTVKPLSPEGRAERAWLGFAAGYYTIGAKILSEDRMFKAGFLAALKEVSK